jgi:hypothetical protein
MKRILAREPGFDFIIKGSICCLVTDGILEWWKNGILGLKSG